MAAFRAGLINDGKAVQRQRKVVRTAIERYREEKLPPYYEFPLTCWPEVKLDRLERLSLRLEHKLFSKTWTPERQDAHRRGFAKTVANKKFCEIDTDATLQQREWKAFFASFSPITPS